MKTIYAAIVAIDENFAIGKGNSMLVHLPGDLKYFKETTSGHTVVMGYNTFLSLPKGALPNRRNIVLSHKETLELENCEIAKSISEVIEMTNQEDIVFFIGGGQIYKEILTNPHLTKLYITRIHHKFDGAEIFFPKIDNEQWILGYSEDRLKDDKNPYNYTFQQYSKII